VIENVKKLCDELSIFPGRIDGMSSQNIKQGKLKYK
jgi:hypothetical protein